MKKYFLSVFLLLLSNVVFSKDLGTIGETFPIQEQSFLEFIYARLNALTKSGEIDNIQETWQKKASHHANRPTPLLLYRTDLTRTHVYKPQITLTSPIYDAKGNILYKSGASVNALTKLLHYKPCWIFFNADDTAQMRWALKQASYCNNPKYILTQGSIFDTEQALNAVIYFDQGGRITQKLKIKHVPSRVTRFEDVLLIEELAIKESGDVL